jgi:hypothetical protein
MIIFFIGGNLNISLIPLQRGKVERKSDGLFLGELMRKIFYELGYGFVNGGVIGEFFPYIEKGKGILFGFYGQ